MSIRTAWESRFERPGRADSAPAGGSPGPVLRETRAAGLTYEPFYGLKEKPFSLKADSRFFYYSPSHAPAFDELQAGIRRRESLNVLTGDIGTGKTTLCRAVLQDDRKTFSAFVPDPFVSREDLLKVMLMDFGVASVDDFTSGRLRDAARTELSYRLYEFLGTLKSIHAFAVVVIDEAQNLSIPLLEEIRILSDADGQLQVVLVGQLELRHKLKLPEMRQLEQRVSVHCHLPPLECDGVAGYVAYRLQTAGGSPDRVRFSPDAIEGIYKVSGGVPRLINRLCDRALYQGHLKRAATIDRAILEAAAPEAVPFAPARLVAIPFAVAAEPSLAPVFEPLEWQQPSADPIDAWLSVVDDGTKAADLEEARAGLAPHSSGMPWPEQPAPLDSQFVAPRPAVGKPRVTTAPQPQVDHPHVESFSSRWLRTAGVAVLVVVTLGVAFVGAPSVVALSVDAWTRATALLEAPAAPVLPVAPVLRLAPALVLPPPVETFPADGVPAATAGEQSVTARNAGR